MTRTTAEEGTTMRGKRLRAVTAAGPRRRALLHLTAMAGVLGLAAGFLAQGASPAHAELTPENGLLVSTREDFRLCVDTTGARAAAGSARGELAASVARVQQHPDWQAAFGAPTTARAAVADSCPEARLPGRLDRTSVVGPGVTEEPSKYRTWVHVLDADTADRLLGRGVNSLNVSAELMRVSERELATVSTAVLVRAGHLDDPAFRDGALTEGIGLQPRDGAKDTSDRIPSVKGTSKDASKGTSEKAAAQPGR